MVTSQVSVSEERRRSLIAQKGISICLPTGGNQGSVLYVTAAGQVRRAAGQYRQIRRLLRRHGYRVER